MTRNDELLADAREFVAQNWDRILADLARLVSIDSSEDLASASDGAPYGQGPRKALDEAAALVASHGFELHDCEGHCGYIELPGTSSELLGIIGHLDVVPAGQGWDSDPFTLTQRDGWLVGRGVIDDKGPLLMAFHALRFWRDRYQQVGKELPVRTRVIFGCAEETGMEDADYYIATQEVPDFLFTPDADFPLCYGEKGQFQIKVSAQIEGGVIESLQAGNAVNGVPGSAVAELVADAAVMPAQEGITVQASGERIQVTASGLAGHAAMPEGSDNALAKLVRYLLALPCVAQQEREWLSLVGRIAAGNDGHACGIACSDADFGPLTCVASLAQAQSGQFSQCVDVRFPTSTGLSTLTSAFKELVAPVGGSVEVINAVEPLIVPAGSKYIAALAGAYETVTGQEARLFTMGGGTYAHHFPSAVSFGAADEQRYPAPEWAGGMHAANEAVAVECLQEALIIYIIALGRLFELDWE